MSSRPAFVLFGLVACGPGAVTAPPPSPAPAFPAYGPPSPPPALAAPPPLYTADEAVRDALASPLQLVGIGGWPGYFRHLSCIYRNDRVIVVDVRCNEPETYQFEAVIDSPTRGRVGLVADARSHGTPLSTAVRASYEEFAVSGSVAWPGPPPLALSMSYDEITAYDELRDRKLPGGCAITARSPQGVCSWGPVRFPPFSVAQFAAANASFFQAPPDEWYALVRTLVAERPRSYAATDLGKAQPGQLRAWGGALGFKHDIDVTEQMLAFVGDPGKLAAVVGTGDGGIAYVGTRRGKQAVVARTDRSGAMLWESVLAEPAFVEDGDTSLVATGDGFIVHVQGFPDPTKKAHHRLFKLDARGKVQWKWSAPIHSPIAVPQFFRGELTPEGTFRIDGYIQLEHDGPVLGWTAEVSPAGKTLREEVGSAELGRRNSMP